MNVDESIQWQRQFIQRIIDECGPRLPGSPEEKKAARILAKEFEKLTGNSHIEEFFVHPLAFIGWIPIAGILLFVGSIFALFAPWVTIAIVFIDLFFCVFQFIKYKQWMDFLFPKAISQNVYSVLEPESGNPLYTIVFSGHIDSSWCWGLPVTKSYLMRYKIYYAFGGVAILAVIAVLRILESFLGEGLGTGVPFTWTFWIIPFLLPGFYFLTQFLYWDKKKASPGAMDNLTGIAMSVGLVKYFKEHPSDAPKDCRIILAGFGSEEAGLRGSRAFAKLHKDDLLAGDVWVFNIDGVADPDDFNLMKGEVMLNVNYNRDFVNIVTGSMREFGLYRPFWKLDVGASDAVTFCEIGKRAYTFAAQNNTPLENYHTFKDTLDKVNPIAQRKMMILLLRVVEKIGIYYNDYQPNWLVDFVKESSFVYKFLRGIKKISKKAV